VYGERFRRVALRPTACAAVCWARARFWRIHRVPIRTSPVIRGKWILENISRRAGHRRRLRTCLNSKTSGLGKYSRCGSKWPNTGPSRSAPACHAQMDQLGFALEKFDRDWRVERSLFIGRRSGREGRASRRHEGSTARWSSARYSESFRRIFDDHHREAVDVRAR